MSQVVQQGCGLMLLCATGRDEPPDKEAAGKGRAAVSNALEAAGQVNSDASPQQWYPIRHPAR